ncbi:MAG TPA: nickel pincer cofactor biosynthesis protein LarC [Nitrospira sp.]|nr:nickel pincer cofactor biosynthesis protein LarC [Nitrospira sp.]
MPNDERPTTNDHGPADNRRPTTGDRIAYLDCFSGISGDMFLGALIDAGVPVELFQRTVEALDIGATLEITRVNRSGISATKVDVIVNGNTEAPREHNPHPFHHETEHPHSHAHSHEHPHDHDHHAVAPPLSRSVRQGGSAPHSHGRHLTEIRQIISKASISESAKRTAITIFEQLGAAEAKIHNVPIEKIHFHEVGAVDAIVDIVCAAVGAEALGVKEFVGSPLNVGGGTVQCAHGTFPVPAPATLELLKGVPVYSGEIQKELVTPTGAAIVATLASRFEKLPAMQVEKIGYGAGTRDLSGQPNVLRILIGEPTVDTTAGEGARATRIEEDSVTVLEANLDDLSPQVFGYVMEKLFEAGALDVFGTPVQMKKNRPGTVLTVLAKPSDADNLTKIIFAETTTLGVRRREERRQVLAREWQTVSTRFGEIRIKVASMNGAISSYAPEYEDCRRIAAEQRVPLKQVMQEAVQAYLQGSKK